MKSTSGTFSRDDFVHGSLPYPKFISYAEPSDPAKIVDVDGNAYIDMVMGLGSYPRGYDPRIASQVCQVISSAGGLTFNRPSFILKRAARLVCSTLNVDKIRPVRTGSDACLGAVTLARSVRPGKVIVCEGNYHGQWLQWKDPARGSMIDRGEFEVISDVDPTTWEKILKNIDDYSCLIYEFPVHDPYVGFFPFVRRLMKSGVLFVADETVTALRFTGNLAIQNPKPDLVVAGKGLANGFGFYCIGGREGLMSAFERPNPPFVSSTYAGDVSALVGVNANLSLGGESLGDRLWSIGESLWSKLDSKFFDPDNPLRILGQPSRFVLNGSPENLATFNELCLRKFLYANRPYVVSLAHEPHLDEIADIMNHSLEITLSGKERFSGVLPRPLFTSR